ncbi:DUF4232 domain-containing protein [Jatrophihabitans sp. DSM 45814]
MTDIEQRLSALLRDETPEPPMTLSAADIERLAQSSEGLVEGAADAAPDSIGPGRRFRRWGLPIAAAAVVLIAVGVTTAIVHQVNRSPEGAVPAATPASTFGRPQVPLLPTASSIPSSIPSGRNSPPAEPSGAVSSEPRKGGGVGAGTEATCATADLTMTVGSPQGAAGSSYTTVYLTNNGVNSCVLQGYPGVSLLDGSGAIVGQPAVRTGQLGQRILVSPGHRGAFTLRESLATQTGCDTPRPSTQLQVYPPDQKVPLRIPFSSSSCALYTTAVTAG